MKRIDAISTLSLLGLGLLMGATTANAQTTATTRNGYEGQSTFDGQGTKPNAGVTPVQGATDVVASTIQQAGPRPGANNDKGLNIENNGNGAAFRSYGLTRFDLNGQLKSQLTAAFGTGLYSFTSIKLRLTQYNAGFTHDCNYFVYYTTVSADADIKGATTSIYKYPTDGNLITGNVYNPILSASLPSGKEYLNSYSFVKYTGFNLPDGNGYTDITELLTGTKGSGDLASQIVNGSSITLAIDPDNSFDTTGTTPLGAATYAGQTGQFPSPTATGTKNPNGYIYVPPTLEVTAIAGGAFGGQVTIDTLTGPLTSTQSVKGTLEFHPVGGGTPIVKNITFGGDLGFYVPGIPAGTYDIGIKTTQTLRRILRGVSTGNGAVTLNFPALLNGDENNNNIVDVDDLTDLLFAFNTVKGDGSGLYESYPNADLNQDGKIDVDDLTDLLFNFNVAGDTF